VHHLPWRCAGRETRVGLRVRVPRRLRSAAIYRSLALQDPEREVGGGSGEAQAFLTPTSSFTSCRQQVSIGTKRTRRRRGVLKSMVLAATRPPTTATAPSQAQAIDLGW
jgi:hypothetical protein